MPLPEIQIKGAVVKLLREQFPADLLGVLELAQEAATRIRQRVHVEGLAADGQPWSPYKYATLPSDSKLRGKRFYWVSPSKEQPETFVIVRARKGPRAGFAFYPSKAHYLHAIGHKQSGRKRFVHTGELRDSVEVTSTRPTVATASYNNRRRKSPYFRAKSGKSYSNQKVAQFAFRSERDSPMRPSDREVEALSNLAAVNLPPRILERVELAETEIRTTRAAKRLTNRVNRLMTGNGVRVR